MTAFASHGFYDAFFEGIVDSTIDLASSPAIKAVILGTGYTVDAAAHATRADLTSEVAGTGYTAGGLTVTGPAWSSVWASNYGQLAGTDPLVVAGADFAWRYLVLCIDNGGAASGDPLIRFFDAGSEVTEDGSGLTVTLPDILFRLAVP